MPFNDSGINVRVQNDFIRRHGEMLDYYTSMKCTCSLLPTGAYTGDANRADPNCLACKGLGLIWRSAGKILGMITNVVSQKELLEAGIAAPGDLILSPGLSYTVSDYDKIELTWADGIPFEGQLVKKGVGSAKDKVHYRIVKVSDCLKIDPATGTITTYTVDVDFTFNGTEITWISSKKPEDGTFYSIKYGALVEWICFAPPQPRYERGTNLGQRIVLRKKHLVAFGS